MVVRRNYGSSRVVYFVDFGEYVEASRSGVVLYKVLFCFYVNKFVVEHVFNVFSNSFLYHGSLVLSLLFVEGWVIQLSVAFVYVPGSVHYHSRRSFIGRLDDNVMSLFKLT